MTVRERALSKLGFVALLTIVSLAAPVMAGADDNLSDGLKRCSEIDDASTRLGCYDGLSGRVSSPMTSSQSEALLAAAAAQMPSAATPPAAMQSGSKARDDSAYSARVTGCSKNVNDQFVFYLDNGEIWRQSNYKRLNLSACDFDVTLMKGMMGYKMRLDGEDRRFRVSRVK